jgi:integrase
MAGRRRKGEAPTMRRIAATNQAYVYLDGKRHYLGPWGSPEARQAFRKVLDAWEATQGQGTPFTPSGAFVTVADLIAAFMDHARVYYRHPDGRPTSQLGLFRWAGDELFTNHADRLAAEFGPQDLRGLMRGWASRRWKARVEGGQDGAAWTRTTVNILAQKVRQIFAWGGEQGLVPESVAALLAAVKPLPKNRSAAREKGEVRPVPFPVLWDAFAKLAPVHQLMVLVQLRCGARPGEVCRMRGDELHRSSFVWKGETVQVPAGTWAFVPTQSKNAWRGKLTAYLVGPRLQSLLRPVLAEHGTGYLFLARRGKPRPIEPRQYWRVLTEAGGIHPNQLRHNFATRRAKAGGIESARQSLGHGSAATTARYVQRDLDAAAADAGRWD